MSDALDKIINHMEFLGYSFGSRDTGKLATHPQKVNFFIREIASSIILFTAFYGMNNDKCNQDKAGLLTNINKFNETKALFGRCYVNDDLTRLTFEAWYPAIYDKTHFGTFIDGVNNEMRSAASPELGLKDYLQ